MERVLRLRGPATVVVLVATGLHLVVVLVSAASVEADPGLAALDLTFALVDPVLLLLLTALVIACRAAPVVDHARGLTVAALALTAVTLVGVAVFGILAAVRAPAAVWTAYLSRTVSPVVVAVLTLAVLVALLGRPVRTLVPELEPAPAEPAPDPVDPQQQPTWTSDTAVGTVWRRAGDAGSERPATSWDAPVDGDGGWGSGPGADDPVEPTRRTTD